MNIGLDLDGVVYPWHTSVYRYFVENMGYEGNQRKFWDYFISELSHDEQMYYVRLPFLYNDTSPTEDVQKHLPLIAELGTIYYITARPEEAKFPTLKFFDYWKLPFKENIIFSGDKANHVRLNKIEYFLDDRKNEVDKLIGITNVYLFAAVHNWSYRENYNTVYSFKEFYEILRSKNDKQVDQRNI